MKRLMKQNKLKDCKVLAYQMEVAKERAERAKEHYKHHQEVKSVRFEIEIWIVIIHLDLPCKRVITGNGAKEAHEINHGGVSKGISNFDLKLCQF